MDPVLSRGKEAKIHFGYNADFSFKHGMKTSRTLNVQNGIMDCYHLNSNYGFLFHSLIEGSISHLQPRNIDQMK